MNDLKNEIDNKLDYVSRCVKRFPKITVHDKYQTLVDMITMLTHVIRRVKNFHKTEEKKLNTYIKQKENGPKNVPDKVISNCQTNMYTAVLWIRKALLLNLNLSKLCSSMQENLHICHGLPCGQAGTRLQTSVGSSSIPPVLVLQILRKVVSWEIQEATRWPPPSFPPNPVGPTTRCHS